MLTIRNIEDRLTDMMTADELREARTREELRELFELLPVGKMAIFRKKDESTTLGKGRSSVFISGTDVDESGKEGNRCLQFLNIDLLLGGIGSEVTSILEFILDEDATMELKNAKDWMWE